MDIIQCHTTHPLATHPSHSLKTNVMAVENEKAGDKVRIYTFQSQWNVTTFLFQPADDIFF